MTINHISQIVSFSYGADKILKPNPGTRNWKRNSARAALVHILLTEMKLGYSELKRIMKVKSNNSITHLLKIHKNNYNYNLEYTHCYQNALKNINYDKTNI